MEVFDGYSVNKGMVLASAAKVRFDFGIPSLTPMRLRALGERLAASEDGFVETEQVILVAERLPITLVASVIPGIEIVGLAVAGYLEEVEIAALDSLLPSATTGMSGRSTKGEDTFPIVGGLGEAFVRDLDETEILLLDGNAGRVFVGPDAFVVSRFQSTATRKRFFLEGAHVRAKTASDNRVVTVLASADTLDEIAEGMEAGADGVYLRPSNEVVSDTLPQTAAGQVRALHDVMDIVGGKPIVLNVPSTAIAYSALLEAAASAPVSMAVESIESAVEIASAMEMTRSFADADIPLGDLSLLFAPPAPGPAELPENLDSVGGVLFAAPWHAYDVELILPLLGMAKQAGKPVYALLTDDWRDEIEDIVRFGVSGLIAAPADASDVKDAIREL